jgi:Rap1a immunity proteins
MKIATMAVALACAAGPAMAQPAAPAMAQPAATATPVTQVQTAGDLAAVCDPGWGGVPRLEAIAYCQGFLTSFGQHHALLYPGGGRAQPLFCLPTPGPTIAQSGVAYAAWARANPRHAGEPALDGLLRWAQATYPCRAAAPRAAR